LPVGDLFFSSPFLCFLTSPLAEEAVFPWSVARRFLFTPVLLPSPSRCLEGCSPPDKSFLGDFLGFLLFSVSPYPCSSPEKARGFQRGRGGFSPPLGFFVVFAGAFSQSPFFFTSGHGLQGRSEKSRCPPIRNPRSSDLSHSAYFSGFFFSNLFSFF